MLFSILAFSLATETQDYDMNGKHVPYYPEALMISHNPKAVVFYHDTTLFNLFVTCAHHLWAKISLLITHDLTMNHAS